MKLDADSFRYALDHPPINVVRFPHSLHIENPSLYSDVDLQDHVNHAKTQWQTVYDVLTPLTRV